MLREYACPVGKPATEAYIFQSTVGDHQLYWKVSISGHIVQNTGDLKKIAVVQLNNPAYCRLPVSKILFSHRPGKHNRIGIVKGGQLVTGKPLKIKHAEKLRLGIQNAGFFLKAFYR